MPDQTPEEIALIRIEAAGNLNADELDLSNLDLSIIPSELWKLKHLRRLNLARNKIKVLPNELFTLVNLEELFIGGLEEMTEQELDDQKTHIESLSGNIRKEYETSIRIWQQENIRFFTIRVGPKGNLLKTIPPEIAALSQLKVLELTSNLLTSLPNEIGQMNELRELYISENNIKRIPQAIGNLAKLNILDISNNQISDLPPELLELQDLRYLSISNNQIDSLPTKIRCSNLKIVRASENKLETLPNEIQSLENLRILDLDHNLLSILPKGISFLKELKLLSLTNNHLPIPPEILEKTVEPTTILNYYFSIFEQKRKSINEIKILIVGQGAVGKTSLVQQILHGTFDQNQTKTEGISINQWTVDGRPQTVEYESPSTVSGPSSIKLNIWDFGGQEIMHATHQFFLTKRSLYLLVLDARLTQEENRVEYWLKIIQSFGGESPVLIVGNKTDQHPLDIDRSGLGKKYPNIVGILETSAATGAGIEALKTEIAVQVEALPHVRDLLPEKWFTVKSKLEELGRDKNFITQDEYLNLCSANDVADETSQHTLIGFLHDLGVVLHFQDDPRLEALGILNPQWVTNGVYKILNSHELFQNRGTLTLPMLNKILNLAEYPSNKRLFIVDMMKKFELCYDIEPDKSFLIPDLLPKDEPFTGDQEWNGALAFQYHYNVLPTSIITRFIVRMNAFIHKTVWRSGVVLKSGGNIALVKADTEDRKIYIWVTGDTNTRRDFLSAIRMEFTAIHKTIVKIEVTEKVPHPDYPELVLDYDELIEFEKQGIDTFPRKVGPQVITVDVKQLLDGVEGKSAPQVFISYAHEDKAYANKLAKSLKAAGLGVWKDDSNLQGGAAWLKQIQQGISQSKLVLNLLSPSSIESEFVEKELIYALDTAKKKVIPLRIKDVRPPLMLANLQYVDFHRKNYEKTFEDLLDLIRDNL